MNRRYYVVDRWSTVASRYPRASDGEWRIETARKEAGIYRMGDWASFYYLSGPIDLTMLKEGSKVWFTDEPRQLYALSEIGLFRAWGRVVVGGLGLGLIHHFLRMNPNVTECITIERAAELERLVWPYMEYGRLIVGDFYEVLPALARDGHEVETIITDFITGYQGEATWAELENQRNFCRQHFPNALFLEHGWQRRIDAETVAPATRPSLLDDVMYDQVVIVR